MNGKDVMRQMKIEGFKVPVIAVSADAMPGTANEIMALGAMDYVTKPIEIVKLKSAMLKALGS
jgi:CheY-like chemotaxis protein